MKYSCIVLFLVLLVRASIQSTIYVDNVDYNYVTTEVPVFVAETTDAELANAGRFTLESAGGLSIETEGPVHLTGSFVHLDSDSSFVQSADGNITLDGSSSFSLASSSLNITAEGTFSLTTVASKLDVNVGGSVEALVDQGYIVGDGSVTINSGGGDIELYSDHIVTYSGQNTNILGENRITLETIYDFQIEAVNSFESRSNLLDFNTLGDIRITSTTDNVNFIAGTQLKLEGESIFFSADEGIDVSSIHGDVFVNSANDVVVTSLDTVDFEIIDDANFISENGPISVKSFEFSADAVELIYLDATDLETTSNNFKIDTVVTLLDTQGSIQFQFTGLSDGSSTFNANEEFLVDTTVFNSNSANLLIQTDDTSSNAGTVIFQSNGGDESYFSTNSVGDTHFSAAKNIDVLSGSIEYDADTIGVNGIVSLDITADFKTFDFVNVESLTIRLTGANEVIAGNLGEIEGKVVTFSHSGNLTLGASETDGTLSFESSGNLAVSFTNSSLISSIAESIWDGYSISFNAGGAPITSSVFADTDFFSSAITFTSTNQITSNSFRSNYVANNVALSAVGSVSMTSSFFDFWANLQANFTATSSITFSFTDKLTFRSFEEMTITDLRNLTASSFLGFEGTENIDIFAANFSAFAKSLSLESNARSDISWTGTNFISNSKYSNF